MDTLDKSKTDTNKPMSTINEDMNESVISKDLNKDELEEKAKMDAQYKLGYLCWHWNKFGMFDTLWTFAF